MIDLNGYWLCAGTLIRTPRGDRFVESLAVGDCVFSIDGTFRTIQGLSCQLVDCNWHSDALRLTPVRIAAHAFGTKRPSQDLLVSRDLPLAIDFAVWTIVPIGLLINGATIDPIHANTAVYWRIELDRPALLIAQDMPIVTYNRSIDGRPFGKGVLDLQEAAAPSPMQRDSDTLIDSLRSRLGTQALKLGWALDDSPVDPHLLIGGAIIEACFDGATATFRVPAGAGDALLVSATSCPHHVAAGGDGRELGVCLAGLTIADDASDPMTVALDDPRLCIGFFSLEPNGMRWTTGRARLPAGLWRDRPDGCSLQVELYRPSLPRWIAPIERAGTRRSTQKRQTSGETIFFWCDETVRQPFETGVQRVTRRLWRGLEACGVDVLPVGWDWRRRAIVTIGSAGRPGGLTVDEVLPEGPTKPWFFMPELSLALADAGLDPLQLAHAYGFRTAALLHDVIPFKLPHLYDADFLRRFRRYFEMFASAAIVFVGTDYVASDLRVHLEGMGHPVPEIAVIPFAAQLGDQPRRTSRKLARYAGEPLRLLTVSTFEPRKNLPRLLEAVHVAQASSGAPIELAVVGHRVGAAAYEAEIEKFSAAMPGVTLHPPMNDDRLARMFEACHASIYPSCEEGFGLPIIESLWLATPSMCHDASAMEEIARGGGVLTLDMGNTNAIARILADVSLGGSILPKLSEQALARALDSWSDYAARVRARLQAAAPP